MSDDKRTLPTNPTIRKMDFIQNILEEIRCEELIPVFEDHKIDKETALLLGDAELKEIFPQIGPRLKFKKKLEELKSGQESSSSDKVVPIEYVDEYMVTPAETGSTASRETFTAVDLPHSPATGSTSPRETGLETGLEREDNGASLDGRAILREGHLSGGLLREGARRKLSQILICELLEKRSSKSISTQEFYRLATDICELFTKESVVVYYSAYVSSANGAAKKNASGKLYESYISRRRKLRGSGFLPGTSRSSSRSSSNANQASSPTEETDEDYENLQEDIIWLKNNVDPWESVEERWKATMKARLKEIKGKGKIEDYYRDFPALQQPEGYTLLLRDFNVMYPGKESNLFAKIVLKRETILDNARNKLKTTRDKYIKTRIQELIELVDQEDPESLTNVALMLLAYVINISPARKQKNKPIWKPSRAEICQGFIAHAASEADVTSHIISRRESLLKLGRTLQPFVIYVGQSVVQVKTAYVVINNIIYGFKKLITAVDCAFKVYQTTGAFYPEESEDIWTCIQIGFYEIQTKYDRKTQPVNTLLTDLGLIQV